ncbi:hypothetical protein ONZ45_g9667 [Pleurotus djamor]|nr:hypothetical protein ONZ45_g9667 [Pleurotus djamor]
MSTPGATTARHFQTSLSNATAPVASSVLATLVTVSLPRAPRRVLNIEDSQRNTVRVIFSFSGLARFIDHVH